MKKIVPFNNVLNFSTDVCEITAISLEHDIKISDDSISGVFFISGEYKIIDGQLEREKFKFELPFDIALGTDYELDTVIVDIDDFRYELLDRNKLKVNIELYIDGEEKSTLDEKTDYEIDEPVGIQIEDLDIPIETEDENIDNRDGEEVSDILSDMLEKEENNTLEEININNENINNNIFNNDTYEDKYVTYKVYRVNDGDTIDKIMEKYNITKEELEKYNNIDDIHSGDKLIIPYNDK